MEKGARRTFIAAARAILIASVIARQAKNPCNILGADLLMLYVTLGHQTVEQKSTCA
jgi:hypothetical protein